MRVKKVKFHEENALMIYVTKEESEDEIIQRKIHGYKEEYNDVAIFVSGEANIEGVLTRIIQDDM